MRVALRRGTCLTMRSAINFLVLIRFAYDAFRISQRHDRKLSFSSASRALQDSARVVPAWHLHKTIASDYSRADKTNRTNFLNDTMKMNRQASRSSSVPRNFAWPKIDNAGLDHDSGKIAFVLAFFRSPTRNGESESANNSMEWVLGLHLWHSSQ